MRDFLDQLCFIQSPARLLFPSVVFHSISSACYLFDQFCFIFDQLCVLFHKFARVIFLLSCVSRNQLYVLLFRSVCDIPSVVRFIQSVVHAIFSISCVWYSTSLFVLFNQLYMLVFRSVAGLIFDQLCLIFHQLFVLVNHFLHASFWISCVWYSISCVWYSITCVWYLISCLFYSIILYMLVFR